MPPNEFHIPKALRVAAILTTVNTLGLSVGACVNVELVASASRTKRLRPRHGVSF
jgi:hypothetical protein